MNAKLNVHYGNYQHIAPFWDGTTYFGTCWRLYHNRARGGRMVTRYETVDLEPDHLYLVPPGLSFAAHQENDPKQFFLHFHADPPYDRARAKVIALPLDPTLSTLLRETLNELRPKPFFLSESGEMMAVALTAAALARIPKDHFQIEPLDPRIEEAIEYLNDRVDKHVDIESVAHEVGMSKGAFIRLFKRETGSTPYHYLIELRVSWTCDLLARDSLPIDHIAECAGFTDRFHFSKVFKKWIGVAPAAYRKRERALR